MFEYYPPITNDDVPELIGKVEREKVIVQRESDYNRIIINSAGCVFSVSLMLMFISLLTLDVDCCQLLEEYLSFLYPVLAFIRTTFILCPIANVLIRVLICIGFVIIPPIVVALVLKLIYEAKAQSLDKGIYLGDGDIYNLQKKANELKEMYANVPSFHAEWAIILDASILGFMIWATIVEGSVDSALNTIFGAVISAVVLYFIFKLVFRLIFFIIPQFNVSKCEISDEFINDIDAACKKETEEFEALKKQWEEERRAEEQARQAKIKAEEIQKGKELYEQATAGDEIDEELMQKAADLGDPNAGIYIGSKIVKHGDVSTSSGRVEVFNKAKRYYFPAFEANIPHGVLFYCFSVIMTESMKLDKAYGLLERLRTIDKKQVSYNQVSYEDIYDLTMKMLQDVISEFEEMERRSKSAYSSSGYSSGYSAPKKERTFTQGGSTGCGIGGSFCGCGAGR